MRCEKEQTKVFEDVRLSSNTFLLVARLRCSSYSQSQKRENTLYEEGCGKHSLLRGERERERREKERDNNNNNNDLFSAVSWPTLSKKIDTFLDD